MAYSATWGIKYAWKLFDKSPSCFFLAADGVQTIPQVTWVTQLQKLIGENSLH